MVAPRGDDALAVDLLGFVSIHESDCQKYAIEKKSELCEPLHSVHTGEGG
jgi:hypothetical protein